MILVENRRVRFDYEILAEMEAGISLEGWEVKSLRGKSANLKGGWITIRNGEAFMENVSISPWKFSNTIQDKKRSRKLLLKKAEIEKLENKLNEQGVTLVPYSIFTKGQHIKCQVCAVRGKRKYEKREVIKNRDAQKKAQQVMKNWS